MVSTETAKLALTALALGWQRAAARRNGLPVPEVWRRAFLELSAVAGSPERTDPAPAVPALTSLVQEVDVVEAARRLGVSRRAVQARCARGTLPARRVGRSWLVRWEEHEA